MEERTFQKASGPPPIFSEAAPVSPGSPPITEASPHPRQALREVQGVTPSGTCTVKAVCACEGVEEGEEGMVWGTSEGAMGTDALLAGGANSSFLNTSTPSWG